MPPKKGSKAYKKAEREKKRQAREEESEESKQKRLEQQKHYDTEKKLQMDPEERQQSSEQKRLRELSRREKMSSEHKEELKRQDRSHKKSSRQSMSPEEKAESQKQAQSRMASFRRSMSPEDKAEAQKQDRSRKISSRQSMSPEHKADVKSQDRESHAAKRKLDKQKVITIEEATGNFKRKCYELPEYVCTCCHRLLWKQSVLPFRIDKYDTTNDIIKRCFAEDILRETKPGELYICTTCNGDLKKKHPIMPAQAVANGLKLDPTPPPGLQKPNQMELMMFRREIPFMKMGSLPRGRQYRMQGPVVNVPSKLEAVCQLLPRLPNEAMLVPIKLKRRLCYKGHYLYDDIRPHVVMEWLKWLKENNPHYAEVNISFDWCNLMTQFQDDGNCIYPSLNIS